MADYRDIERLGWAHFRARGDDGTRSKLGACTADGSLEVDANDWDELVWKVHIVEACISLSGIGAPVTASVYTHWFGHEPRQDDLQRVNCDKAGELGHFFCGMCLRHAAPRFMCGCPGRKR